MLCQVCFFAVEPSLEPQESQQRRATSIVDADVARVFRGCLDNIPQLPTNTVRIFLSSTFSGTCVALPVSSQQARHDSSVFQFLIEDFRAERNALHKLAYPQLQQFCRDLSLDFQVTHIRKLVLNLLSYLVHQKLRYIYVYIKSCAFNCPSFNRGLGLLGNLFMVVYFYICRGDLHLCAICSTPLD